MNEEMAKREKETRMMSKQGGREKARERNE